MEEYPLKHQIEYLLILRVGVHDSTGSIKAKTTSIGINYFLNNIQTYICVCIYTYIQDIHMDTYIHIYMHMYPCVVLWKYCAQRVTRTHISCIPGQCATITPQRLPDVTIIPTPICLCSSLPQRSVQTTTYVYICIYTLVIHGYRMHHEISDSRVFICHVRVSPFALGVCHQSSHLMHF